MTLGVVLSLLGVSLGMSIVAALLLDLLLIAHVTSHRMSDLMERVGAFPALPQVRSMLDAVHSVMRGEDRFRSMTLTYLLDEAQHRVSQLNGGSFNCSPDEFMRIAERLFGSMKQGDTFSATSLLAGGEYWANVFGVEYERLNLEAAGRGAKIVRVYVLRDEAHLQSIDPILRRQAEFSEVRYLLLSEEDESRPILHRDFFLINDRLGAEFHFKDHPVRRVAHIEIITSPGSTSQLSTAFKALYNQSQSLKTPPART